MREGGRRELGGEAVRQRPGLAGLVGHSKASGAIRGEQGEGKKGGT